MNKINFVQTNFTRVTSAKKAAAIVAALKSSGRFHFWVKYKEKDGKISHYIFYYNYKFI